MTSIRKRRRTTCRQGTRRARKRTFRKKRHERIRKRTRSRRRRATAHRIIQRYYGVRPKRGGAGMYTCTCKCNMNGIKGCKCKCDVSTPDNTTFQGFESNMTTYTDLFKVEDFEQAVDTLKDNFMKPKGTKGSILWEPYILNTQDRMGKQLDYQGQTLKYIYDEIVRLRFNNMDALSLKPYNKNEPFLGFIYFTTHPDDKTHIKLIADTPWNYDQIRNNIRALAVWLQRKGYAVNQIISVENTVMDDTYKKMKFWLSHQPNPAVITDAEWNKVKLTNQQMIQDAVNALRRKKITWGPDLEKSRPNDSVSRYEQKTLKRLWHDCQTRMMWMLGGISLQNYPHTKDTFVGFLYIGGPDNKKQIAICLHPGSDPWNQDKVDDYMSRLAYYIHTNSMHVDNIINNPRRRGITQVKTFRFIEDWLSVVPPPVVPPPVVTPSVVTPSAP